MHCYTGISRRKIQNYSVFWVDNNTSLGKNDFRDSLKQLRAVVNEVGTYRKSAECIKALNELDESKAFVISSGALGYDLVSQIHDIPCVDTIYILCENTAKHEPRIKDWAKIEGVYNSITPICDSMKKVAHACDHNNIPMSMISKPVITAVGDADKQNLNKLPSIYMYSIIFKEIILQIADDEKQMQNFVKYCRDQQVLESQLTHFQNEYDREKAVWWYTYEVFLYSMLNKAFRSLDMESMSKMGFFIRHLHLQLKQLYQQQANKFQKTFIVFRGQGLSQKDFQYLCESKGGLLSFNNFLSTSKRQDISMEFAERTIKKNKDSLGVLFIMTIDPKKISTSETPFACMAGESAMDSKEDEILFTIHTVFQVMDIKQRAETGRLYEVQLSMTSDRDPQLAALHDYIKRDIQGLTGWHRMGQLMVTVGHIDHAEKLYNRLLDEATSDEDRAHIYHKLGLLKQDQGKYQEALKFYELSFEIKRKMVAEDDISLADTYHNIGFVHNNLSDYSKALEFYEKSLKIREKALSPNNSELTILCLDMFKLYLNLGNYSKTLEFYEKLLKIEEKTRSPNDAEKATFYNLGGDLYFITGDYSKALEFYDNCIQIREMILSNQPDLGTSYSNIGRVYYNIGDYSKALHFYEKANKIWGNALPPNHSEMGTSYKNIGGLYNSMGDYSTALEFYEKGYQIWRDALPPNDPQLVVSLLLIPGCYERMGDYLTALTTLEETYKIQQEPLQENNLTIAYTHGLLGRVYRGMKEYFRSLDYFQRCLTVFQQAISEKHPSLAKISSNIGDVHRLMGDYQKALKFHQKALDIQENVKCDPLDPATTYINLGETYREMKEYSTALKYYERGLKIRSEKLPENHPDIAAVYHNMTKLYLATGQYSIAMKYVQQAVDVAAQKLPSTHPDLSEYREAFETIRKKM